MRVASERRRDEDVPIGMASNAGHERTWCGPVMTADGRISPKMSTHVTESRIATFSSTSTFRKIGSASLAPALHSSSATRRW